MNKSGSDFSEARVKEFLDFHNKEIHFDARKFIKKFEFDWHRIESDFINRIGKLFQMEYPAPNITAYLTTNQRCTYNIDNNFFFVYFDSKAPNRTIMHELFHFYTWYGFHDDLIRVGLNQNQYEDIKESLTELLNDNFSDLMYGMQDHGYPQHEAMRKKIKEMANGSYDLKSIVSILASDLKSQE